MIDQIPGDEELVSSRLCPFCGVRPRDFQTDNTFADVDDDDEYNECDVEDGKIELPTYAVFCMNCLASGPVKKNRNEAIYYWNQNFS